MTSPNAVPDVTRTAFLDRARHSGVLVGAQLDRAAAALSADVRTGAEAAVALVADGTLTRFQADRLLTGKYNGLVLGQYLILDQIWKGSTGRVYRARHRTMNRLVAVKVFAPDQTQEPVRRARFQTETRAAARLAHPNVVTILDSNEVNDRIYLVLEYVDGASADHVLRRVGSLKVSRACEIVRQAALGLQHAHEKGTPHGVVYPGNILVGRVGGSGHGGSESTAPGRPVRPEVKVTNFGVARAIESDAVATSGCDPADFRAPEALAEDGTPGPRADLYGLGCTLFYLLTGRPPFPGGTAKEKASQHLFTAPPPVELLRPDVPPAVAAIVRALLSKKPADRLGSAAEVAIRLEPFAESDDPAVGVDFNLDALPGGPPSFMSSAPSAIHPVLTGAHPVPAERPLPPAVATAAVRSAAVAVEVPDASPWAGIEISPTFDAGDGVTPIAIPRRIATPPRRGIMPMTIVALALTVLFGTLIASAIAARLMGAW
ncbi:serine/threonine-protein kinase [Fimbriiglobus ruber]|uniref:Serine/threonine protein kinase PrkC, regulator of stationary phase n=1 Tax=Fimbriiglobus ruber TaxID=1908690 RepID=A0A225E6S3_9BACT|nr:serine/threonine-protein kinase [Fimbriiglobus ruber]OWK44365.1 Serine/threonine protein kinase PrkC, regulator of stationary phase [Fimbriiglobus ruber]